MRLHSIALLKKVDTGEKDKLGNPITELSPFFYGQGRKSIWTSQELAFDSRITSKNLQKAITTIKREKLLEASKIVLNSEAFSLEEIKGEDEDRWRVIYLKSYGK